MGVLNNEKSLDCMLLFLKRKKTIVDYGIAGWTIGQYVHVQIAGADKIKFK